MLEAAGMRLVARQLDWKLVLDSADKCCEQWNDDHVNRRERQIDFGLLEMTQGHRRKVLTPSPGTQGVSVTAASCSLTHTHDRQRPP